MVNISVIVPIYNVEKYLKKCLESLVTQTLDNFEILAINDGSLDGSQKIVDEYCEKYSFVKSYIKENGGQSDARNFGVEKANGEYIAFVDADDWIEKDALEKLYKNAKENKSDIVVCDIEEVYEDGTTVIKNEINLKNNDIKKACMIAMPGFCDKIFRKNFLKNINFKFPNGIFYEDLAVYPFVVAKANKISYVKLPLYKYRIRKGSTMKQNSSKRLTDIFTAFDYLEKCMSNIENQKKYAEEIEYIYIEHLLHSAALRFLNYESEDANIVKISNIIKIKFPKWRKNVYYKSLSIKYKIVCNLIFYKKIKLVRKILKIHVYDK